MALLCLLARGAPASASALLAVGSSPPWSAYRALLAERPLATKAATSSVIMALSDALAQRLEARWEGRRAPSPSPPALSSRSSALAGPPSASVDDKRIGHSWSRTRQSLLTGLIWSGPVAHFWYQLLEVGVGSVLRLPPAPLVQLAARIALDAALFSPFTVAGYFVVSTILQGGTARDAADKLGARWRPAVAAAWSFWPLVNVANFGLVPLPYRVLYANVMSLLWTGYLSYVNNLKKQEQKPRESKTS
jgi:protein Mpv17